MRASPQISQITPIVKEDGTERENDKSAESEICGQHLLRKGLIE